MVGMCRDGVDNGKDVGGKVRDMVHKREGG